jgi:hypothetical protein
MGQAGSFSFEAIEMIAAVTASYVIRSISGMDDFCYIYASIFNVSNMTVNLIAQDDDSAGSGNCQITITLQSGATYVMVYTTFSALTQGSFTIRATGPGIVSYRRINALPTTTTGNII